MTPVQLVRSPTPPPPAPTPWPTTNWFIVAPLVVIGLGILITVHVRWWRSCRYSDSERAFRRLASAMRLHAGFRVLARELADAHGRATPAALLLSDAAFREAALKLDPEPGSARARTLHRWAAARGV